MDASTGRILIHRSQKYPQRIKFLSSGLFGSRISSRLVKASTVHSVHESSLQEFSQPELWSTNPFAVRERAHTFFCNFQFLLIFQGMVQAQELLGYNPCMDLVRRVSYYIFQILLLCIENLLHSNLETTNLHVLSTLSKLHL